MTKNTTTTHQGPPAGQAGLPILIATLMLVISMAFIGSGMAGTARAQGASDAIPSINLDSDEPGQLTITWQAPQAAPTDYRIRWANADLGWPSWKADNEAQRGNEYPLASVTSLTLSGLTPGDDYKVQIRSRYYNADRTVHQRSGPWTNVITQRVKDHPPVAPTGLTTSAAAHDSLTLTWDDPQDANITGYRVMRGPDAGSLATLANTQSDSNEYTDSTVAPETTYHYAVMALSQNGDSTQSGTFSVTTPAAPRPEAPTGLTADPVSHDSLTLTWNDPQDANITRYRILRGPAAESLPTLEAGTKNAGTEYTDSTVEPETTYHYAVIALSPDGDGDQSDAISITTPAEPKPEEQEPPAAPTGLSTAQVSQNSLTLTWNDPQDDSITGYRILRGSSEETLSALEADTQSADRQYTDSTVTAGTTYFYAATALSANGAGTQSDAISVTTQAERGTIPLFTMTSSQPGQLIITWETPEQAPTDYWIRWAKASLSFLSWNGTNEAERANPDADGSATTLTLNDLTPGEDYKVQMRSRYFNVDRSVHESSGPWTDTITETVLDSPPQAPGAPQGFTVTRVGHSVLTLTWNDPQDNSITGYRILRGTGPDNLTAINSGTESASTRYEDDTVAPETTYHYAVQARSAGGEGGKSSAISATTTADPKSKDDPPQRLVGARQSQTAPVTLVSNQDQTGDASATYTNDHGQAFTTGATKYTVTSVTIGSKDPNNDTIPLQICEVANDESPTAVCWDLTGPSTYLENTLVTYTAPTSPALTLDVTTTYMVVFKASGELRVDATTSAGEDSASLTGWSIRDKFQWNNGGTWQDTSDNRAITITITGSLAHPPPTAADSRVTGIQDTPYTFSATDFNFSPQEEGDTLESIQITTLPTPGSLTLSNVAVTVNQSVTRTQLDAGNLKYAPASGGTGVNYASFSFKVTGTSEQSTLAYSMTITVNTVHTAPLAYPSDRLVSNINIASSGSYTVQPFNDVAIQLPSPGRHESVHEDGWNINTIRIRVTGVDPGEQLSGRLHPGGSSSGPSTGLGGSSGKRFASVQVSPDGIATFSNLNPRGYNPQEQHFYFIVSLNSGEIEVSKADNVASDAGTPNDLELGPTWHRTNSRWSPDSTTTDRIQILITGSVKRTEATSPEPPQVPTRPSPPSDSVPTYRLGSWQSVDLTGSDAFDAATYKTGLQKDTNYRVEFRTSNSHQSYTATSAGMQVTNNLVDRAAVFTGVGSTYLFDPNEEGDPSTTLAKAISWFRQSDSHLKQGIWEGMLHEDFRTPDIVEAGGNPDCDSEADAKSVQETACLYQFDYPAQYYLDLGTGVGTKTVELVEDENGVQTDVPINYGTMQFRISRKSDQTLAGISRIAQDAEASFLDPGRVQDPVLESGVVVERKSSGDGEVHFPGDIDWYVPQYSLTPCSFSIAGRDLDDDVATDDSASGLRMRAYDRNHGEPAAPGNRGSFRSSLSGILLDGGQKLLEVTGTRAGGYRIIATCEVPPEHITGTDNAGRSFPQKCDTNGNNCNYDDHLPRRDVGSRYDGLSRYGHHVIDLTRSSSRSVTGTISHIEDIDRFRILATPGHRYSITAASTSVTLATPGHDGGETTRMAGIGLKHLKPFATSCKDVHRTEGMPPDQVQVFEGLLPGSLGLQVTEFENDGNPNNVKADLGPAKTETPTVEETCMFLNIRVINRERLVGGYRITVRDEGMIPNPVQADNHSPLMHDEEDLYLMGSGNSEGLSVFITREAQTDDEGNTHSPSNSIGAITGNGRMDSYDDIDLFRKRVSPGLYEVILQSEAIESSRYGPGQGSNGTRLNSTRVRASGLKTGFSVLEGPQGEDAGYTVDLTPSDPNTYDPIARQRGTICKTVGQESYVADEMQRTRPRYECKETVIAPFEAEYHDYYYVRIYQHGIRLGAYSVQMRVIQEPYLSSLANSSDSTTRVFKARATVRNPRQTTVHAQYRKQGEPDWIGLPSRKTSSRFDDIIELNLDVEFTIPSPDPGITYNVRASLTEDFSSEVRTLNIRTAPDPAVSRVRESNLTHNSADLTVSLSNGRAGDHVKIWRKKTTDPDSVTWEKQTLRLTASNLSTVVFNITGLEESTSYDVRAVASRSTIADDLPDMYSSRTFSTGVEPN